MVGGAPAPSDDYLRRQAFIRQEQMARSQAGLILLPDGATYQDAIESSIARELAEQRQAADAAALAKAKPKGPPPHLVGTEVGQPFGAQLGGQQLAPEVMTAPPARAAPSRPPPEVTTPAVTPPPSSSTASSAPTSSTLTAAAPSTSTSGVAAAADQAAACAGVPPPPTSPFPPVDRVGRAGYGTRNQIRRPPAPGLSAWDAFRFPLHEPGADLRHKEIPYSVEGWTADTWAEAQRLEAAIASGAATPPQSVSAGVILRSLPPTVRGGRLPRERPADFTQWIGWCFVKCPGSHRRGRPCPDNARCLRPVNRRCWAALTSTTSASAVHRHRRGSASTRTGPSSSTPGPSTTSSPGPSSADFQARRQGWARAQTLKW